MVCQGYTLRLGEGRTCFRISDHYNHVIKYVLLSYRSRGWLLYIYIYALCYILHEAERQQSSGGASVHGGWRQVWFTCPFRFHMFIQLGYPSVCIACAPDMHAFNCRAFLVIETPSLESIYTLKYFYLSTVLISQAHHSSITYMGWFLRSQFRIFAAPWLTIQEI